MPGELETPAPGDEALGPVVLTCRPLPPMEWVAAQGLGISGAYIFAPFVILPVFSMLPAAGALVALKDEAPWVGWVVFTLCFALIYSTFLWLVYFQPRGDHLIVHAEGFRLKITFKQATIFYRDLKSITFGLESQTFQAVLGHLGAGGIQQLADAAINLHLRDGRTAVFKSFLHRFEQNDLEEFASYLRLHRPQLLRDHRL